jgi:cell division protease FtsH
MEELHRLSAILIERETIDKDQFLRLLEGASEEEVFPEEIPAPVEEKPSRERKPVPTPKPFPVPGAMMQPPPPDPAKS